MSKKFQTESSLARAIFKYLVLLFLVFCLLLGLLLFSVRSDFQSMVRAGLSGRSNLSLALDLIKKQDWDLAALAANEANTDFNRALSNLDSSRHNFAIKHFSLLASQVDDLSYLLKSGEILSRSLVRIIPVASNLDSIRSGSISGNFASLSPEAKADFLRLIYQAEPEISGLRANLKLALLNLDKIKRLSILWPIYEEITEIKHDLETVISLLDRTSPLVKLLPALTGYPGSSQFLFIMQNNDELRPAGGFIGVYGLLEVKNGEILNLNTSDSYHLDMPASQTDNWRLEPPAILQKHLRTGKWYLRDANWSPDWSQSARQINYIYNGISEATGREPRAFTGIIGITPDLIADLIALVGPIDIRGETYTPENFQPLLQYNVEVAYKEQDISQWDRKNIVGEIMDELKERLFHLPSGQWTDLLAIFDRAVAERDLQMYFQQPAWQALARELGASGEVQNPDGDYLLVVDANLAAFKSDAVMKKNISYQIIERSDYLEAELTLNYKHEGGFDWRTTRYRSYTRVYAPLGSQLLSSFGLDEKIADFSQIDDDVLNKSVFGFFFVVEPGASGQIKLRYQLPDFIYQAWLNNNYTLLVQKQAGRRTETLSASFQPQSGRAKTWTTDFTSDRYFWFKDR